MSENTYVVTAKRQILVLKNGVEMCQMQLNWKKPMIERPLLVQGYMKT